jgi:hypothetical protein
MKHRPEFGLQSFFNLSPESPGGLYLSIWFTRASSDAIAIGFPLPTGAFERSINGQWHDFASPLSVMFAAVNMTIWTCGALLCALGTVAVKTSRDVASNHVKKVY